MSNQRLSFFNRRRGSILIVTLVLMALAAISSLLMAKTLQDHQRLNTRRRELWQAFYDAEAGIAQVQHWAMYPNDFTVNTALFARTIDGTTFATRYPNLYAKIATGGTTISENNLSKMAVGMFKSSYGKDLGKIKTIELEPPAVSDPIACDFKITSVGRSGDGAERSVIGYAKMNPVTTIKIPAALISFKAAAVHGNAKIHWGEAWSKNKMSMESRNQYGYLSDDPKAIWRTESLIDSWGGGWKTSGADPDINLALNYPTDMGVKDPWNDHFYQNVPAAEYDNWGGWPSFDYQTFKDMALANGRYYSTDAAGNVYRDGVEDAAHKVDFLSEFGVADRDTVPYDLTFIDTIDGTPTVDKPPAADGSNLAKISVSGTGKGLKGVYYIGASFDVTGVGSPPPAKAKNPYTNSTQSLDKIFLEGVLYAAGQVAMGGNAGVYGSVVAQKGFGGGGTPDIYYNAALANGLVIDDGNVGSPFKITLNTNY